MHKGARLLPAYLQQRAAGAHVHGFWLVAHDLRASVGNTVSNGGRACQRQQVCLSPTMSSPHYPAASPPQLSPHRPPAGAPPGPRPPPGQSATRPAPPPSSAGAAQGSTQVLYTPPRQRAEAQRSCEEPRDEPSRESGALSCLQVRRALQGLLEARRRGDDGLREQPRLSQQHLRHGEGGKLLLNNASLLPMPCSSRSGRASGQNPCRAVSTLHSHPTAPTRRTFTTGQSGSRGTKSLPVTSLICGRQGAVGEGLLLNRTAIQVGLNA